MAQSGHEDSVERFAVSDVKRTLLAVASFAMAQFSRFRAKRAFESRLPN